MTTADAGEDAESMNHSGNVSGTAVENSSAISLKTMQLAFNQRNKNLGFHKNPVYKHTQQHYS